MENKEINNLSNKELKERIKHRYENCGMVNDEAEMEDVCSKCGHKRSRHRFHTLGCRVWAPHIFRAKDGLTRKGLLKCRCRHFVRR